MENGKVFTDELIKMQKFCYSIKVLRENDFDAKEDEECEGMKRHDFAPNHFLLSSSDKNVILSSNSIEFYPSIHISLSPLCSIIT